MILSDKDALELHIELTNKLYRGEQMTLEDWNLHQITFKQIAEHGASEMHQRMVNIASKERRHRKAVEALDI